MFLVICRPERSEQAARLLQRTYGCDDTSIGPTPSCRFGGIDAQGAELLVKAWSTSTSAPGGVEQPSLPRLNTS